MTPKYLAGPLPPPGPPGGGDSAITNPLLGTNLQGLTGAEFFAKLISVLVNLGLIVGVLVFFFVLIIGAIGWITSGGDKAAVEQARGRVISALVGLVILFAIWALLSLIETIFGINILTIDIQSLTIQ